MAKPPVYVFNPINPIGPDGVIFPTAQSQCNPERGGKWALILNYGGKDRNATRVLQAKTQFFSSLLKSSIAATPNMASANHMAMNAGTLPVFAMLTPHKVNG